MAEVPPPTRRVGSRSTTLRLALRNAWMEDVPQPPMDKAYRTESMPPIKTGYLPGAISGLSLVWPQEVKDVITDAGLQGTMQLRGWKEADRQHGLWHLNNLNPVTLDMRFRDNEVRHLDRDAVVLILGLNGGSREVPVVNPGEREELVRRVLRLLGEDEKRPGGLTIKMLREFLEKPCPLDLTPEYKTKVKVCYTLLAVSCFLGPRSANPLITEEAMYLVLNPDEIGHYDLASYTLTVLRESAHRARTDQSSGSLTILAGGCLGLLEVFHFDWLALAELDDSKHIIPRCAAYSGNSLKDLVAAECFDSAYGKIYGRAGTRPLVINQSPAGEGSTGQGSSRTARINNWNEFVAMVLSDQHARASQLFERVCHEYRLIDEQIEAERKRRRNEVNIAAGALDVPLAKSLTDSYLDIVAQILATNGVVPPGGAAADPNLNAECPVMEQPAASIVGFCTSGVPNATGLGAGPINMSASPAVGGIHDEGGINTVSGAAAVLESMRKADYKGKALALDIPEVQARPTQVYSRRVNNQNGLSSMSIRGTDPVRVWDVNVVNSGGLTMASHHGTTSPGELDMDMMYASDDNVNVWVHSLHPSLLGLSHVSTPKQFVDEFHDSFSYLDTDEDMNRRYYVSMDRPDFGWSIILTGRDFRTCLEDETEISYHMMAASNRDTNLRDRAMYANVPYPWGALLEPDWAVQFLYDPEGTSVEYMDQLMSEARIGYNISKSRMIMCTVNLLDTWSLYGFDLVDKEIHVLDPIYQDASDAAFVCKHGDSTKCLLTGLRRCGDLHGYGWDVVESEWKVKYHHSMHPRCSHENTGVYVFLYTTEFNGETVPNLGAGLSHGQVSYLRRKMMYQVNASSANTGDVPAYLIHNGW